jgi:uncharacterized lipoprotein
MKKRLYPGILIGVFTIAAIFYSGCTHQERVRKSSYPEGKLYHEPYKKVWDTVNRLIFTDLGCTEKTVNKENGYIETEWTTQVTIDGTERWRIIAQLKQKNDGTLVLFNKDIGQGEEMKRNKPLFMEQSKDGDAYNDWKDRVNTSSAADDLYKQLENKLQ